MAYFYLKSMAALTALFLVMSAQVGMASLQFRVGGPRGWHEPVGNETDTYNQWAERNRFQINDDLYFKYSKGVDSVCVVTVDGYNDCNCSNPIAFYNDGSAVLKLNRPGPFYFISGASGHCQKGQKLIVVVMSPSYHHLSPSPSDTTPSGTVGIVVCSTGLVYGVISVLMVMIL